MISQIVCFTVATMKESKQDKEEKQTNRRQTLNSLCSRSGLLLSAVCCIALIHVELRIQEHHRLISHSVTFCDKMETEILRKVRQNYERWQVTVPPRHWQPTKGKFHHVTGISIINLSIVVRLLFTHRRDSSLTEFVPNTNEYEITRLTVCC